MAPGGIRDVGFCSQIGVFQRVTGDLYVQRNNTEQEPTVYQLVGTECCGGQRECVSV